MPRFLMLLLLLLSPLRFAAQDSVHDSKVEVFGGYQFLRAGNFDGTGDSANTNGWNTSATFKFARHIGITADFSGNYKTEELRLAGGGPTGTAHVHIYTYTFGPEFSRASEKGTKFFAHALFGAAHVRPTGCVIFSGSPDECGSGSAGGFAMILGGGIDTKIGKSVSLRLVQADWLYLPSQFGAQTSNARISSGLVFHF